MVHETGEISETVIIMPGLLVDFVKLSSDGDVVLISPEFARRLIGKREHICLCEIAARIEGECRGA